MRAISSRQNPLVRVFQAVSARAEGARDRVLLDGLHLLRDARAAGIPLLHVAVSHRQLDTASDEGQLAQDLAQQGADVVAVSDPVMALLSPVRTPSGIVAIAARPYDGADTICAHPQALVVVVVDVQDPGTLGALVRAAEAGGATGAIVCGQSADPLSWKALRGSMGSALRLPVARLADPGEALLSARRHRLRAVASVPHGGRPPAALDWRQRVAVVLGGEGAGLPEAIAAACDDRITIPMAPAVESLNVAVAAALLVYEARRQRS